MQKSVRLEKKIKSYVTQWSYKKWWRELYKWYKKEKYNILRNEKRLYTQKLLEEVDQNFSINNIRQLYRIINTARGGSKKREHFLKEDDGILVTKQWKIMEKWTGY